MANRANTEQQNVQTAEEIKPPTKVKIIVEGHEDAGKSVAKGATIEVDEAVAKMLVEQQIGELA